MVENKTTDVEPRGDIFIVPTSHVSERSSAEVTSVVGTVCPDVVAVELDDQRLQKLVNGTDSDTVSITDLFKQSGISFRGKLVLYVFTKMQSKIRSIVDIDILGADMLAGYDAAREHEIPLALVDRDITETFNRLSSRIQILELLKTLSYFVFSYLMLFNPFGKETIDKGLEPDQIDIDQVLELMDDTLPTFKEVLIDERNEYIAEQTIEVARENDQTVLVIGAAHEPGVREVIRSTDGVQLMDVERVQRI